MSGPIDDEQTYFPPKAHSARSREIAVINHGRGSFYHASEASLSKQLKEIVVDQPALLHPRTEWPESGKERTIDVHSDYKDFEFAKAVPVRPSYKDDAMPFGVSWKEHTLRLWDLHERLWDDAWAGEEGLGDFLTMITYGLEDVVAVFPTLLLDGAPVVVTNLPKKTMDPVDRTYKCLLPKDLIAKCTLNSHHDSGRHTVKQDIFDRRFVVGLVNYKDFHWASYIFDRRSGQVFYYDTLGGRTLLNRQKAFACAWRLVLTEMGYPYDFDIFCTPVADQPGGFECGYLAVYLVFLNLRSMTGATRLRVHLHANPSSVTLGTGKRPVEGEYALPQRDWLVGPFDQSPKPSKVTLSVSWERVKTWFLMAIRDELGFRKVTVTEHGHSKAVSSMPFSHHPVCGLLPKGPAVILTKLGGYQLIRWTDFPAAGNWTKDSRLMITPTDTMTFRESITLPEPSQIVKTPNLPESYVTALRTLNANQELIDQLVQDLEPAVTLKSRRPRTPPIPLFASEPGLGITDSFDRMVLPRTTPAPAAGDDYGNSDDSNEGAVDKKRKKTGKDVAAKRASPKKKADSRIIRANNRTKAVPDRALIDGIKGVHVTKPMAKEAAETAKKNDVNTPAYIMTVRAAGSLHLLPAPRRWTHAIDRTGSFATFVPDGLISLSQWDAITDTLRSRLAPPPPAGPSRADRAAARELTRTLPLRPARGSLPPSASAPAGLTNVSRSSNSPRDTTRSNTSRSPRTPRG